ncbi:hypothetical protein ACGH7X_01815 [Streptomyces sp. BBFR51]|uniref:hypothetical protein n=1 Tax=Streptomyces sp. BBFR51 TaxID=3372856 RepID=UPI0037DC02D2
MAAARLDAYANAHYRSLKNARTDDVDVRRESFARVEAVAREAGHAPALDAWGEDLALMRPGPVQTSSGCASAG